MQVRFYKKLSVILFLFSILSSFYALAQTQQVKTMFYGGEVREYIIYVPSSYNALVPTPLMFNFHGGGGSGSGMMNGINDMRPIADTAGFIAVYPSGSAGAWMHKSPTTYNDIYFVEAIIDTIALNYNVDNDRVYACGYSEGGIFSYELACRLSNRIAAIASVSGSMMTDYQRNQPPPNGYSFPTCSPSHPTAIMFIPGTNDSNPNSYYIGLQPYYMSASDISSYWSNHNNTNPNPTIVNVPSSPNTTNGSSVERKMWESGDNCVSVVELKVNNGEHDWPGSFGNMDINASKEIWKFVSLYDINGLIDCFSTKTNELLELMPKKINRVIDILGRETNQTNQPLFYIYDDGTVEKRIIIE